MLKNRYFGLAMAIMLGALCSGTVCYAVEPTDPFSYQVLTNLGPCTSSRVLLMNNDTNPLCPIEGQGYHDTSNTVNVGQTYWWHDDTPVTDVVNTTQVYRADYFLNLQLGVNHILYQKNTSNGAPIKLWELKDCRAGSAARTGTYNYLPWSDTCQPIDKGYPVPIPVEYSSGYGNSNGTKQVATVIMRATMESQVLSPWYEEGVGSIYFDGINIEKSYTGGRIAVEVSYEESPQEDDWIRQYCEVYLVSRTGGYVLDKRNTGKEELWFDGSYGADNQFYRVKVHLNTKRGLRFRIIRTELDSLNQSQFAYKDYRDLILLDNIIVTYPDPKAILTPTGIDSDGMGFAKIGRVGAFKEPFLSKGMETAWPRMTYAVETNGLPSFIDWKASVTNSDFVWRWCYLNQAYSPWTTNKMSVAGDWLVGDTPISVTNRIGDVEYYYVADVVSTHYKFLDFADYIADAFPETSSASKRVIYPDTTIEGVSNYWSRIREGVSPWQEMCLESYVITNAETVTIATNSWNMELIGDHMWRGFVHTPTNYAGCVANIRFVGKNMWESNGVAPTVASQPWYFPIGEITDIPMGGIATTVKGDKEQDIVLDASTGYLMFEFNDISGAFTMNRAEYQDFNKWTPSAGQEENKYIGDFVNTSYVGRAKQEYTLDVGNWPMSRSTSGSWWENFDKGIGDNRFPLYESYNDEYPTPNGWTMSNGMFINGMFSSVVDSSIGLALQLQGRGAGKLSLIDPADVPSGIGTISFSARLAQYMEFSDFYCYEDGSAMTNYAVSAKVAMTNRRKKFSDVSTGSPSLSLVTYYRIGKGCYEFRVTRVSAAGSGSKIWDKNGKMEAAIYKWSQGLDPDTGNWGWISKKLNSQVYEDTNASYLIPNDSGTNVIDNTNWSSMYFAARTSGPVGSKVTYLEGGIALKANNVKTVRTDTEKMSIVSWTDEDKPFEKGSYGVCACECPGTFGNMQIHELTDAGPYRKNGQSSFESAFGTGKSVEQTILNNEWGTASPNRIVRWLDNTNNTYNTHYGYGVCAPPISQKLHLRVSPNGEPPKWTDTGLNLTLTSFLPQIEVFSPRTTSPVNIQISVGGKTDSLRTDVVIDDVMFSQWAGDESKTAELNSETGWAFTDGWISGSTNDVYNGTGSAIDDELANISKCGYYVKQINETEYIYVFTNTPTEVSFVPKFDLTVKELFVLGGGGGGGPGGGGGGGGESLWITNTVEYYAGESGIRIKVGEGGKGGSIRYSDNKVQPTESTSGVNSYVWLKNPITPSQTLQYRGYGGYRGGSFYPSSNDKAAGGGSSDGGGSGGGSAVITEGHRPSNKKIMNDDLHTYGKEIYGAGYGGKAVDGAPGGGGGGGLRGLGKNGDCYAVNDPVNTPSVIVAGTDGMDGTGGTRGGNGGNGFPLSALGESELRYAIGGLLGDDNAWLGGGGGGGSGTNAVSNEAKWGKGAVAPGDGGLWSGGRGGNYLEFKYEDDKPAGMNGVMFAGGGGGGGTFVAPLSSGTKNDKNWILGGGNGGGGLVVMRVKIKDRFVMLQPMRGSENDPMSIRTPLLNGISLLSFSWKHAHSNSVLKVQIATNDVNDSNIRALTTSLDNNWTDFETIDFSKVEESRRAQGSTNILMGLRAPVSGIVRLLMDPAVIAEARAGATTKLDSMYGTVVITGMKVFDEPELDDRSWWGWNIMPTYKLEWSSLYDPVTLGPGRSCGLNFSGVLSKDDIYKGGNPDYDPEFADNPEMADYKRHDPFVQTPRFTNRIGAVMFKARVTETNLQQSGWVTISACADPTKEEMFDANWVVLTNIEVKADTTVFEPFLWRIPTSQSDYQALRLTAWGAAEGRYHSEPSGKPFGDSSVSNNPTPIQRVLLDEVVVTQPMAPKISLKNAYPFRRGVTSDAVSNPNIASPDEQPLLGESFGMQVQVIPAGMEDELDVSSIRIYMAWYAGEFPWGYENWKDEKYAVGKVELKQADDWSADKLIYRSDPEDPNSIIPPQMAGENGYKIVQYHIWAEYTNKNGIEQTHHISEKDWTRPGWYFGIQDPNDRPGNIFCPYTVLDSISPKRAWFNEINAYDAADADHTTNQYIEVAVPQGLEMSGWFIQCIKNESPYQLYTVANFGVGSVVPFKTADATNRYAFIAIQSPKTKNANTHRNLNDGTWLASAFDGGEMMKSPYALRLTRPTGIIEHEVVFMSTNTSSSIVSYMFDGTNLLNELVKKYPENAGSLMYAGADAYSGSLGVFTSHGENTSCWTNTMRQTPGTVNLMADGTPQSIDINYFEPPKGTNLWIYANIDDGSLNSLSMVFGTVTNKSSVIIVPQGRDGTFSTSIVYAVKKWFTMDKAITNEVGRSGGNGSLSQRFQDGNGSEWVLDLSGIRLSDPETRMFEVTAFTRDSDKLSNLPEGKGVARDDLYYPAIVDWLQSYDEKDIRLAEFWSNSGNAPVEKGGEKYLLSLKQMYWLNIDPVAEPNPDGNSEWALKGGMSSGSYPVVSVTNALTGAATTNIRCSVTLMITNLLDGSKTYAPNMLRGRKPGSTSHDYDEKLPGDEWDSVTFKITGALQNGLVNNIYRPLRWFTFGPDSFSPANGFTRVIDIVDPYSTLSPGFSHEWYKHPESSIWYRWAINDDADNKLPFPVYQLNDENALLNSSSDIGSGGGN